MMRINIKGCQVWVFVLLSALALSACGTTTFQHTMLTEGTVHAPGPPTSLGELREKGTFTLQGGYEETFIDARKGPNAGQGGSGNNIARRQLRGAIMGAPADGVEFGLTGRYASASWDRAPMALDAPDTIERSLTGAGMTFRARISESDTLSLHFEGELELVGVPFHRLTITKVSFEGYGWPEGQVEVDLLDPEQIQGTDWTITGRLGLGGVVRSGPIRFLFGAGLHDQPMVRGLRQITTTCNGGSCDGPTSGSEVPALTEDELAGSIYGGIQFMANDKVSIIAVGHASMLLSDPRVEQNTSGLQLGLRLDL